MGGSAITKLNQVYKLKREDWAILSHDAERIILKNRISAEQIQQYQFTVNDISIFTTQRQIFEMGYRSQNLVSSKHLEVEQINNLCSTVIKGSIFIQRIPLRLSDINQIPYPDILHFYSQCFKGFSQLYSRFGYFQIAQDMICCNQYGKVKVWMNSNIDAVRPEVNYLKPEGTQRQMLQKVMQLLDLNTNQAEQSESLYLFISSKNCYTFMGAYSHLMEYVKIHKSIFPNYSNSIVQMIKVLKDNPNILLNYNNPFNDQSRTIKNKSQIRRTTQETNGFSFTPRSTQITIHKPLIFVPQNTQRKVQTANYLPKPRLQYFLQPQKNIIKIQEQSHNNSLNQAPINVILHNRHVSISPATSLTSQKSIKINQLIRKTPPKVMNVHSLNVTPKKNIINHSQIKSIKNIMHPTKSNGNLLSFASPSIERSITRIEPIIRKSPQKQKDFLMNNDYYSNLKPISITNNFNNHDSLTHNLRKSTQILPHRVINIHNNSLTKTNLESSSTFQLSKDKMTPIKHIAFQRINRFKSQEESTTKKLNSFVSQQSVHFAQQPKQPIIFVNKKQNSSFVVIPQSQSEPRESRQLSHHSKNYHYQPTLSQDNQYYVNYQNNEDFQTKPLFPPPEIVNIKRQEVIESNIEQPKGSIYVKKKLSSLQNIHSIYSNNYASMDDVRVSHQINKTQTESGRAMAQTAYEYPSSQYDFSSRALESPVQYKVTRQQYHNAYKQQQPQTMSTYPTLLYNYYDNQQYNQISSQPKVAMSNQYFNKIDSGLKQDLMNMKIKINDQSINYGHEQYK